jgi:hypothetical protein
MKKKVLCLGFVVSALAFAVLPGSVVFAQDEGAAEEQAPLTPEESAAVRQAAEKLVKEEIEVVGSFEVDHPDTGDALSLSLDQVQGEVTKVSEDVYKLQGGFKDDTGSSYVVELQLEKYGENEYEIVDAIVISGSPKPSAGEEEVV